MAMAQSPSLSEDPSAGRSSTNRRKPAGARSGPSGSAKPAGLEILFSIVLDSRVPADQRRSAALEATRHLLPKKPSVKRWWVNAPIDEYGFAITPEIASEYRDTGFGLRNTCSRSDDPRIRDKIKKLKARLTAIQLRLQCPCPSDHGKKQRSEDSDRVIYFLERRETNAALSAEESAEEAHRRARLESFYEGPEYAARQRLYALKEKERIARARRLRLTRRQRTELRFLRLLYPQEPSDYNPYLDESYNCPLRDASFAQNDMLYPPDSKLRPPKDDEIEEEFVEIPPYCYPPHARLPPPNETDILYVDEAVFRWSNKLLS
jgi:hypothetical protein